MRSCRAAHILGMAISASYMIAGSRHSGSPPFLLKEISPRVKNSLADLQGCCISGSRLDIRSRDASGESPPPPPQDAPPPAYPPPPPYACRFSAIGRAYESAIV